jgi:hypothetical protein
MMSIARSAFMKEHGNEPIDPVEIMEISIKSLSDDSYFDAQDYLARIDLLNSIGKSVMISNRSEFYKLAEHLRRNTNERIGLVLGVPLFRELFDEKYYQNLEGGLLEGVGKLFKRDLQLYVYPVLAQSMNEIVTASTMQINPDLGHLLAHLCHSESIVELQTDHPAKLGFSSKEIVALIERQQSGWEELVHPEVAKSIKKNGYFGYQPAPVLSSNHDAIDE